MAFSNFILRRRVFFVGSVAFVLLSLALALYNYPAALDFHFRTRPTPDVAKPVDKGPRRPIYKKPADRPLANRPFVAVKETFPLAAIANSSADLPPIPSWNRPPTTHVPEKTPLFIGFTRNWFLLQQTVVSFLAAGWPPEDIYVVENTGVMDANKNGKLTMQNPFFLDHHRLTKILGVNVLITPSLQTFAQLQNFYLSESINRKWPQYFWSHMDIVVQSAEDVEPYKSFYMKSVDTVRQSTAHDYAVDDAGRQGRWALRYFAYDWVTLMNTAAMEELGGWDTMISYYKIDCDMYERMRMAGFATSTADAGPVYDVGDSFEDLLVLYRRQKPSGRESANNKFGAEDQRGSKTWTDMQNRLKDMGKEKNRAGEARNRWQIQQMGGQGEPYYRDMDGFAEALEIQVQAGISSYNSKWRVDGCSIRNQGLKLDDEWKVQEIVGE